MRINNTDISAYNAKQRTIAVNSHNKLQNDSEWLPGSSVPYLSVLKTGMKDLTVTLWVYGAGRNDIVANCSSIIASMMNPSDFIFDGYPHKFRGVLQSVKQTEKSVDRFHILELGLSGYEYGDDVTVSGYGTIIIQNPGNIVSPGIVEVTPSVGASSIQLTGICRDSYLGTDLPCTIKTLTTGNTVRLDAIAGIVTENGSPKDVDLWTLPSFKPGNTTVTCNNNRMGLSVTVRPIYI